MVDFVFAHATAQADQLRDLVHDQLLLGARTRVSAGEGLGELFLFNQVICTAVKDRYGSV